MPNRRDLEAKPNPSSARRLSSRRKQHLSLSALNARLEDALPSRDADPLFLERKRNPPDNSISENRSF